MAPNLKDYAGLWVALTEQETVGGVGHSASDAFHAARIAWPKERLRILFVSEHAPHVSLPVWPIQPLQELAFEERLWLVGGAVRDLLLGLEPDDWDFTVTGDALRLARNVADHMDGDFYVLDAERGTGRAIATPPYRRQSVHLDFARIRGNSIEADLYARDFTINAIAMTIDGRMLDPTGGIKDLKRGRLSMVRRDALSNDPIRLLRAVRLSHQFDLTIAKKTQKTMGELAPAITSVAAERVQTELIKLLRAPDPDRALASLKDHELLPHLFPEVADLSSARWLDTRALLQTLDWLTMLLQERNTSLPSSRSEGRFNIQPWVGSDLRRFIGDLLSQWIDYLNEEINQGLSRDHLLRWAALFHAVHTDPHAVGSDREGREKRQPGSAAAVASRCRELRLPNDAVDLIKRVVANPLTLEELVRIGENRRTIYHYFQRTDEHGLAILWFTLAHSLAHTEPHLDRRQWRRVLGSVRTLLNAYFRYHDAVVAPVPLLDGYDLIQLGLEPGPQLGEALGWLVEAQAAGEIQDREQAVDAVTREFVHSVASGTDGETS